jgi:hypothetical protein
VSLSDEQGARVDEAHRNAVATIADNDGPKVRIEGPAGPVKEGSLGEHLVVTLSITLDGPSVEPVTIHYRTRNGVAVAPSDYQAVADQVVTFEPGATSTDIQVTLNGDASKEPNESFKVVLTSASGASLDSRKNSATVTIQNDD